MSEGGKLTLLSAPAGFGKTTLVSEWVAGSGSPAAWLSLDEGDSDPTRFLTYLVAALQTIAPNLGEWVLEVLQAALHGLLKKVRDLGMPLLSVNSVELSRQEVSDVNP